jgi:serine protease
VINLSLGSAASCSNGSGTATNYINAIAALKARGVAVVVSAGNDSLGVNLPANCAGAIAVAGLRHAGSKNGFSSLGPEVTISAPGGNCPSTFVGSGCQYPMLSTINSGKTAPMAATAGGNRYSNGTDSALGTSFSAPLVSATVGLMFSANPALSVDQMRNIMRTSARAFPTTGGGDPATTLTPPVCHIPAGTLQEECYCTTANCGAGMLDAGAALRAVALQVSVANFSAAPSYPTPGQNVALNAASSSAAAGQTITGYQWQITADTTSTASFTSAINASTATLKTGGTAGTVTVQLTITDGAGTHVTSQRLRVGDTPSDVVTAPATGSGKSGGGSLASPLSAAWLAGLALAVLTLAVWRRRAGR